MIFSLAKRKLIAKWYLSVPGEQTELSPLHKDEWYTAKKAFPFGTVLFNTCVVQSERTVPARELSRAVRAGKHRSGLSRARGGSGPGCPAVPSPLQARARPRPFVL